MTITVTAAGVNASFVSTTTASTVAIPQGALVVLLTRTNGASNAVATASDGTANVYTKATATTSNASTSGCGIFFTYTKSTLPSGTLFQITTTKATTGFVSDIMSVTGLNGGSDQVSSTVSSASVTSLTLATGALKNANSVAFGVLALTVDHIGQTAGAGFTFISSGVLNGTDTVDRTVVTTTAVTWNPTWTNAQAVSGSLATFFDMPILPQRKIIRASKGFNK